jgi:hypothetical protein
LLAIVEKGRASTPTLYEPTKRRVLTPEKAMELD